MMQKVKTGPLYVDGNIVYPDTLASAVKTSDGKTVQDYVEEFKRIGTEELRELKEVIDQIIITDMYEEGEATEVVDVDAGTLGGIYTAADITKLLNQINELTERVKALEAGTTPSDPEEEPIEAMLEMTDEDTGVYTKVEDQTHNVDNVSLDEIGLDEGEYYIELI